VSYTDLQQAVAALRYKTGWSFQLRAGATSSAGICGRGNLAPPPTTGTGMMPLLVPGEPLSLLICVETPDSSTGYQILVEHTFGVPYPEPACRVPWHRWLLDRILDVERHEAMEFFSIGADRPFYPEHGPGADLYGITERMPAGTVA